MKSQNYSRIAQWILSLALPPDRAAAAVGDWMEEAIVRGEVWFWSCVVRTTFAHLWDDFMESPGALAGLAIRSWLLSIFFILGSFVTMLIVLIPVGMIASLIAHGQYPLPAAEGEAMRIVGNLAGIAMLWLAAFRIGSWISKRAPGHEITACLVSALMQLVLNIILEFVVFSLWGADIERFVGSSTAHISSEGNSGYFIYNILFLAGLLAGAVRTRRNGASVVTP